jgi:hypothetical protein
MSTTERGHVPGVGETFAQVRERQSREEYAQRGKASKAVTSHAIDATDCEMLLAMLGLETAEMSRTSGGHLGPLT